MKDLRKKLKTAFYQYLIQDIDLDAYFLNLNQTLENHVAEIDQYFPISGSDIVSGSDFWPAIRYKLVEDGPSAICAQCDNIRDCTFEVYIESRQDNSDESDTLMDLVRNALRKGCGTDLGLLTQTEDYKNKVGDLSIGNWPIEETYSNQYKGDGNGFASDSSMPDGAGRIYFAVLRFEMTVAV